MEDTKFGESQTAPQSVPIRASIDHRVYACMEADAWRRGLKVSDILRILVTKEYPPQAQSIRHEPHAMAAMEAV